MDEKAVMVGHTDGMARKGGEAIARIMGELAGCTEDIARELEVIARALSERSGVSMEVAVKAILNALQWEDCETKERLVALNNLLEGCQKQEKSSELLDLHMEREKRMAAERAAVHRFRQYKSKASVWQVKKRAGRRQREWRGPWREN